MFDYLSSPMRWCESKFIYSIYIAEFWNSLSSLFISLIGYYGYIIHKDLKIDNTAWYILIFIGLSSFWFHFTLSFLGQFFDELGIILLVSYCIKNLYKLSIYFFFFMSLILSLISWFIPFASPFIFLSSGTVLALSTYKSKKGKSIENLWLYCIKVGVLSIFLWIFDFVCLINTHCYWHITIGFAAYLLILFIYKNDNLGINDYYVPNLYIKSKNI